jgi:hypothetical protein
METEKTKWEKIKEWFKAIKIPKIDPTKTKEFLKKNWIFIVLALFILILILWQTPAYPKPVDQSIAQTKGENSMLLKLIQTAVQFVSDNASTVAMIFAITAWAKSLQPKFSWLKDNYLTVFAFVVGFLFIFPEGAFVWDWQFIANGIAMGLTATGVYKGGSYIAIKAQAGGKV